MTEFTDQTGTNTLNTMTEAPTPSFGVNIVEQSRNLTRQNKALAERYDVRTKALVTSRAGHFLGLLDRLTEDEIARLATTQDLITALNSHIADNEPRLLNVGDTCPGPHEVKYKITGIFTNQEEMIKKLGDIPTVCVEGSGLWDNLPVAEAKTLELSGTDDIEDDIAQPVEAECYGPFLYVLE